MAEKLYLPSTILEAKSFNKLEKRRAEKRMSLYLAQDLMDAKKEDLLTDIEQKLRQKIEIKELFTIKWKMV